MKKRTCSKDFAAVIAIIVAVSLITPAAQAAPAQPTSPATALVEEGIAALARSEFIPAENQFRRAIALDPNYALAYSWTGQTFAIQPGREKEALEKGQKAASMAPEDGRVQALLADVLLRAGDLTGVSIAENAAELSPDDALVQSVLARAYMADSRWDKALAAAQDAVKLDPKLARAYHALGRAYQETADFVRAISAFEEAVRLEPQAVEWHLALATLLAESVEESPAATELRAVLKILPNFPLALVGQAKLYLSHGLYQNAEEKVRELVKAAPNVWQTRLLQGDLSAAYGEYSAAVAHYQRALAVAPGNLAIVEAMAEAETYSGDCTAAKDLLQEQLKSHPRVAQLHTLLSDAYICLEDYRKALSSAEDAVELNPYDHWAWNALASAQRSNNRTEEALESYGRAVAVAPAWMSYNSTVGQLLLDDGAYAEAEGEFSVANRLFTQDPDLQFRTCIAQASQEKYQQATHQCAEAHKGDPQNAAITRLYGLTLLAGGQPAKAVLMLQLALRDEPDSATGHHWLAAALMKTRKYKEAQAEYEAYLKLADEEDEAAQQAQQMVDLLKSGYSLNDKAALAQITEAAPALLKGALKAQVTGKTAKDRSLALQLTSPASATNEQMFLETMITAGLAAHFAARLDLPVAGATIRSSNSKGALFLGMKADIDGLQDIALSLVSPEKLLAKFEYEPGAASKQGVTSEDIDRIGKEVAEVRGLSARKPISVTMISAAEFAEGYEEAMTDEMVGEQAESEALFKLLGALGPKESLEALTSDVLNEQVLGYYDSETEALRVLKDKTPDAIQRLTVAHEYVHALQDQNFTLLDDSQRDSDAELAVRAVVEGDASLAAVEYASKKLALAEMAAFLGSLEGELDQEALESAPEFLSQLFEFPYSDGQSFVNAAFERGGWKAVNDLYAKPPVSTEQVLHPETYRSGEKPLKVTLPTFASALGDDWALAEEEVVGELGWRALLQKDVGRTFAAQAAKGWGGDRYALLKNKAGDFALAIQAQWDSAAEGQEFEGLLRQALSNRDGFKDVTSDLLAANPPRVWQGAQNWWILMTNGDKVFIAVAKTRDLAEKIITAFDE